MADLSMTSRGLMELRIAEHNEEVTVKKQALFTDAQGVVDRRGFFRVRDTEVTIDGNPVRR